MPINPDGFANELRGIREAETLTKHQIGFIHDAITHLLSETTTLRTKLIELEGKIIKKS